MMSFFCQLHLTAAQSLSSFENANDYHDEQRGDKKLKMNAHTKKVIKIMNELVVDVSKWSRGKKKKPCRGGRNMIMSLESVQLVLSGFV